MKNPCALAIASCGVGVLILALALHLSIRPGPERAEQEQYAVYSAYIEDGLTGESRRFGDGIGIVLVSADTEGFDGESKIDQLTFGLKALSRLKSRFAPAGFAALYDFFWANLGQHKLKPRFTVSSTCELLTAKDLSNGNFRRRFPHSYSYLTFSPIGFNCRLDEAFLYAAHVCPLCGGGEYVLMRKVQGSWRVVARHMVWVS